MNTLQQAKQAVDLARRSVRAVDDIKRKELDQGHLAQPWLLIGCLQNLAQQQQTAIESLLFLIEWQQEQIDSLDRSVRTLHDQHI